MGYRVTETAEFDLRHPVLAQCCHLLDENHLFVQQVCEWDTDKKCSKPLGSGFIQTRRVKSRFLREKRLIIFPAAGRRWQETRSVQTSRQIPPQKKKNWGKTGWPHRKKKMTDMKTHVCVWEDSVWFRVMGFLGNEVRAHWQLLSLNKHADAQSK